MKTGTEKPASRLTSPPRAPAGMTAAARREFRAICAALIEGPGLFRLDLGPAQRLAELRAHAAQLHGRLAKAGGDELADLTRLWLASCREARLQEAALGIALSSVQRRAALEVEKARESEYMAESEAQLMAQIEEALRD